MPAIVSAVPLTTTTVRPATSIVVHDAAGSARSTDASVAFQGSRATIIDRVPVLSLDRIYMRGMRCVSTMVPKGTAWARMSDHLPFVAELRLDQQA